MTRARARQINGQALSLLCTYDPTNENITLHSCLDLLVPRNKEEIKDEDNVRLDQTEQRSCMHVMSHPCMHSRVQGPSAHGQRTWIRPSDQP